MASPSIQDKSIPPYTYYTLRPLVSQVNLLPAVLVQEPLGCLPVAVVVLLSVAIVACAPGALVGKAVSSGVRPRATQLANQ